MQVVQSVNGKFHHFHLARQLHQRRMLAAIFSTYPASKLRDQHIPMSLVHSFPGWKMLWLLGERGGLSGSAFNRNLAWHCHLTLDNYVASRLPECDVFIGLSSSGLQTGKVAQKCGGKYVCDRGSSHIRFTNQILTEEFARWGQTYSPIPERNMGREEEEYAQADIVTIPSEFARRTFVEMGVSADKVKKVQYGADLSRFAKTADPDPDRFDVLFVGQVSFRKGIPYLLEAFQSLHHPKKHLTLVGAIKPEIKQFLSERSLENVTLAGALPASQLKDRMSRSHVLVLPSIEDGFGMVIGEAMACGCPVIGSENTGTQDFVEDGREGFVVPIRSPQAIMERLEQLAQDAPLRQAMSERALERVKRVGGWDAYGADYVAALESLTGRLQEVG